MQVYSMYKDKINLYFSISSVLLATALASGFSIAALTQCFLHVSGKNYLVINF